MPLGPWDKLSWKEFNIVFLIGMIITFIIKVILALLD